MRADKSVLYGVKKTCMNHIKCECNCKYQSTKSDRGQCMTPKSTRGTNVFVILQL